VKQANFDPNSSRLGVSILDTIDRALTSAGLMLAPATETEAGARTVRPGRPASHVYSNDAGSRMYRVYRPSDAPAGLLPVVVMLHGCTQSAEDFEAGTQMNRLVDLHGFIVVYPEQPPAANPSKCWNWFSGENQVRDRGEPSLIAGITREVIARDGGDPRRVFIAGLSAGGAMAVIMAEAYPDLYAAAGVHSGLPYASAHDVMSALAAMRSGGTAACGPEAGARAVPVIVFHGDSDPTVHPSIGLEIVARAGQAHAAWTDAPLLRPVVSSGTSDGGRRYTRIVHEASGGHAPIEAWTLHGGGHAWSGGHASGSHTDGSGPDASAEMVRFFLSRVPMDAAASAS
jgi:poly(hydroxyalkanoate) depolymerase family esterase